MKLAYLTLSIVIGLSICSSFAQLISTTETPSQTSFEVGAKQMTTRSITPSQTIFALRNATSTESAPTQMSNLGIANALKEGDALHVLVANNGTTAMNLTKWQLVTDNRNLAYTFPVFTLMPGTMVTIHMHQGKNMASDLYGSNFMWNGTHEIKLLDNNKSLIYDYRIQALSKK